MGNIILLNNAAPIIESNFDPPLIVDWIYGNVNGIFFDSIVTLMEFIYTPCIENIPLATIFL